MHCAANEWAVGCGDATISRKHGYDELKLYHEGDDGDDDGRGGIHDSGDVHSICAPCRNNWAVATIDIEKTRRNQHYAMMAMTATAIAAICSICALCRRTLGFGDIE